MWQAGPIYAKGIYAKGRSVMIKASQTKKCNWGQFCKRNYSGSEHRKVPDSYSPPAASQTMERMKSSDLIVIAVYKHWCVTAVVTGYTAVTCTEIDTITDQNFLNHGIFRKFHHVIHHLMHIFIQNATK